MSFGFSIGDAVLLTRMAWTTVQNCRKACGTHHELTREAASLYAVLQRLSKEVFKTTSSLGELGDDCQKELQVLVSGCEDVLQKINEKLARYSSLSERSNSARKIWQKVRFGNGQIADLEYTQARLHFYVSKLSLLLQTLSIGSLARVEQQMHDAGGELQGIRLAIEGISAHILAEDRPESILTTYSDDDKTVWRAFRRELIQGGFSSALIHRHKDLIKAYISELADRASIHNESVETPVEQEEKISGFSKDTQCEFGVTGLSSIQGRLAVSEVSALSPGEREYQPTAAAVVSTLAKVDRKLSEARSQDHKHESLSTEIDYRDIQIKRPNKRTASFIQRNKAAFLVAHLVAHLVIRIVAVDPDDESVGSGSSTRSPAPAPLKVRLEQNNGHPCRRVMTV